MGAGMNPEIFVAQIYGIAAETASTECKKHEDNVRCSDCRHFSSRQAGYDLASLGYGRCARECERGRFLSARHPRQCAGFAGATPQTIECRKAIIHQKEQCK